MCKLQLLSINSKLSKSIKLYGDSDSSPCWMRIPSSFTFSVHSSVEHIELYPLISPTNSGNAERNAVKPRALRSECSDFIKSKTTGSSERISSPRDLSSNRRNSGVQQLGL
jgi:hypothetical protein